MRRYQYQPTISLLQPRPEGVNIVLQSRRRLQARHQYQPTISLLQPRPEGVNNVLLMDHMNDGGFAAIRDAFVAGHGLATIHGPRRAAPF